MKRTKIDALEKKGLFWKKIDSGEVQCYLCAHGCRISGGSFGVCGMRRNVGGELYTYAFGSIIAGNVDPVEKKPLYHFLPGTATYSIATFGCNFSCSFCQNWSISQVKADTDRFYGEKLTSAEIVNNAVQNECRSISYTYTEPTIFFEYASDIGLEAKKNGLKNIFVTNGFMTSKVVKKAATFLDAANIDLKFFSDDSYRNFCKGRLQPVLDTIKLMKELGVWVEITTLIIPGVNDSENELRSIAGFIAEIGTDIPWHVSRFHPDYHYLQGEPTPVGTIENALKIGKEQGLKYLYPGNINAPSYTICPGCGQKLIERMFMPVLNKYFSSGKCIKCGHAIAGVWD